MFWRYNVVSPGIFDKALHFIKISWRANQLLLIQIKSANKPSFYKIPQNYDNI